MTTMRIVPPDVLKFAQDHETVGGQVLADATAAEFTHALAAAIGPAGQSFTAEVGAFESAIARVGAELGERFQQMGEALRDAVDVIATTDEQASSRFRSIGALGGPAGDY